MLNLNVRQIKLLNKIFKQDFLNVSELTAYLFVSVRTLQMEIKTINDELVRENYQFEIANHRGRGYYLKYNESEYEVVKMVTKQCNDYLENSLLLKYGNSPRVLSIIRILLVTNDYIKSYDICDYLHISDATLTNDLRIAREILSKYGILVISVPHYGMKISGNEISIRNCLIDFCDIYSFTEEKPIFIESSLEQYQTTHQELKILMKLLKKVFIQFSFSLSEISFNNLIIYLTCIKNRKNIDVLNIDTNDFINIKEYDIAKVILKKLDQDNKKERLLLCCFLTVYCQSNFKITLATHHRLYESAQRIFDELNIVLIEKLNLDLSKYENVEKCLLNYLMKWWVRKKYKIITYSCSSSIIEIMTSFPASASFVTHILFILNNYEIENDRYLMTELFLVLHNSIFVIPNSYHPINIALISRYGKLATEAFKYGLQFKGFNVNYDSYSPYELDKVNWNNYACAILIKPAIMNTSKYPVIIFEYDYHTKQNEINTIWGKVIMKHHIDNLIFPQLTQFKSLDWTIKDLSEITRHLKIHGYYFDNTENFIMEEIKINAKNSWEKSCLITLFSSKKMSCRVFNFVFDKLIIINNQEIREIKVLVLDMQNNALTVKQGDSAIRRFLNKEIEIEEGYLHE